MENEPDEKKASKNNMSGATLGINLAVGMAVFTFIGNWIDKKLGDRHIWILVGMFMGLFYCGYEIWKLIRQNSDK